MIDSTGRPQGGNGSARPVDRRHRYAIRFAKIHLLTLGRFRLLDVALNSDISIRVLLVASDQLAREGKLRFVPGRGMVCSVVRAMPVEVRP